MPVEFSEDKVPATTGGQYLMVTALATINLSGLASKFIWLAKQWVGLSSENTGSPPRGRYLRIDARSAGVERPAGGVAGSRDASRRPDKGHACQNIRPNDIRGISLLEIYFAR